MDYKATLSQKKLEFIQQIVSEKSLDTLRAWMDMYDEPATWQLWIATRKN